MSAMYQEYGTCCNPFNKIYVIMDVDTKNINKEPKNGYDIYYNHQC